SGSCCSAERFELIFGSVGAEAEDHRDLQSRESPDDEAECGKKSTRPKHRFRQGADVEKDLPAPVFLKVETGGWYSSGDGGADVHEVAVSFGSSAKIRVGEDDRVRLAPRDLLALCRSM